jgi:hypothetical protein
VFPEFYDGLFENLCRTQPDGRGGNTEGLFSKATSPKVRRVSDGYIGCVRSVESRCPGFPLGVTAEVYRNARRAPREAVSAYFDVSPSTAARYIRAARAKGFLEPLKPGLEE